jgi:hypothetical protein
MPKSIPEVDDEDSLQQLAVEDVIDACLDFDEVQIARVIIALVREGNGSLIDKCLKTMTERSSAKASIPAASGIKAYEPTSKRCHESKKNHASKDKGGRRK